MSFTIFQNKKTPFQAIKTRSSKSRKIDVFPKGLTHGFGPKMAIFQTFFFQAVQPRKMSFTIFYNKKTTFQAIKTTSSKSRKIDIFPHFSTFFLGSIGQENVFYDILREENDFLGHKKKKFKQSNNWHFSKWVTPWFWSKNCHFSNFFFCNIRQEHVFNDILKEENAFLGYKHKKFKKPNNDICERG